MGGGVKDCSGFPSRSSITLFEDTGEGGLELAECSEVRAVVGDAFVGAAEDAPVDRTNGAMRPPLKDTRDDEVLLAREPGRSGEDITGECA